MLDEERLCIPLFDQTPHELTDLARLRLAIIAPGILGLVLGHTGSKALVSWSGERKPWGVDSSDPDPPGSGRPRFVEDKQRLG